MRSRWALVTAPAFLMTLAACDVPVEEVGVPGLEGVLAFEAPTDLVFSENLAVGSTFEVTARPLKADEVSLGDDVDVAVNVVAVATVAVTERAEDAVTFQVSVVGPGSAVVVVTDGDVVLDRVELNAVPLGDSSLVDATLLPFAEAIDVTVPVSFALVGGAKTTFGVAAIDRCGNGVLDLGASTLALVPDGDVEPDTLGEIVSTGLGGFDVTPAVGDATYDLVLQSPGLAPLSYGATTVANRDINEVRLEVAAADGDTGSLTTWGRAFASGDELLGVEGFTWTADARITLNAASGPVVTSTFGPSVSPQGEPDSPGGMTVSLVGEEASIDLLTFSGALVATRGAGPTRPDEVEEPADEEAGTGLGCAGCDGAPVCDPLAALLPVFGLRRLSRRRRR